MKRILIEMYDADTGEKIYSSDFNHEFRVFTKRNGEIEVPSFLHKSLQSFLRGAVKHGRDICLSVSVFPCKVIQQNFEFVDVY